MRQAISLAFDRKEYLEGIGSMNETPALGSVAPSVMVGDKNFREYAGTHGLELTAQPEKAQQLLAEAGYPRKPDAQLSAGIE